MPNVVWTPFIVPNLGIDETRHPQNIDERKWSSATNVEALPDGIRRRLGSYNVFVAALANAVTAIIDYRKSDATTFVHLVFSGGRLYKVSGSLGTSTTTLVTGAYSGTMTSGANVLPSWTIGNDRLFLTNNVEVPKKYYRISSVDYWENEGIAAPTATPTLAQSSSGNNLDGAWEIDYYYWNSLLGIPSDRRYGGVSAASITVSNGQRIDISGLPSGVARTGDRATHIRIEAKEPSSSVFRLVKEIALGTTSTTITDADLPTTTAAEYDHAVAPVHKIKLCAENRQFILNVSGSPFRLMFSAIIGTTPYYESFPATNYRDFGRGDGDYGTALAFIPPRLLIVGFKNSIYAIDARRPGTSDVQTVARNIGIAGHRSLVVVGQRLYFISDADENKGPFVWTPGSEPQPLLGIDDTFKAMSQSRLNLASCVHYAPGDNRFQIWTLLSSSAATQHDRVLVYDYGLGAWMVYTRPTGRFVAVLDSVVNASGVSQIFGGSYAGQEYVMDQNVSADSGTGYEGRVTLKAFDYDSQGIVKQHRYVDYTIAAQTTGAVTLMMERDYGERATVSASLQQMSSSNAFTLGTSVLGGSDVLGAGGDIVERTALRGRARIFRPTLTSSSQWYIKGIAFGIQPTGVRRA